MMSKARIVAFNDLVFVINSSKQGRRREKSFKLFIFNEFTRVWRGPGQVVLHRWQWTNEKFIFFIARLYFVCNQFRVPFAFAPRRRRRLFGNMASFCGLRSVKENESFWR
jgi:hypothetical protein